MNGTTTSIQTFQSLNLTTGATKTLTLAPVNLGAEGLYSARFTISNPDVTNDESPANNILNTKWVFSTETQSSPLRVTLDNGIPMSLVSPLATEAWEDATTNFDNSLVYMAYDNTSVGEQSWAVTPTLDLSGTSEGSFFFDTSYGKRASGEERLRVMVSEDCGIHYDTTIFDMTGSALSNTDANTAPWLPATEQDWTKHYVSLNEFAGKDQVRFAFVVDNGHGNNLYLDNLEWFVQDDPSPPQITDLFSVYSSESNPYDFLITFNLEEKAAARLVVYNTMGQVLIDNTLPETLNQTYTVNLYGQSTGVYLVRLHAGSAVATTKLFVGK